MDFWGIGDTPPLVEEDLIISVVGVWGSEC